MKNFLLILLFSLTIIIWSNVHCIAQTTNVKTDSTAQQIQQTQTTQNSPDDHCYLSKKPFSHWETWVIIAAFFIISALVSVSSWEQEDTDEMAGCLLFIIIGVGLILAAALAAVAYESLFMFFAFFIPCVLGVGFLGQAIAAHRIQR